MDENISPPSPIPPPPVLPQARTPAAAPVVSLICPQCHQPVKPEWYFCPNCGKKLSEPGLSTSVGAQFWLYAFSAILPFIGWLAITKWEGIKYARSDDPKAQEIGWIAIAILAVFSIYVTWEAAAWIMSFIQAQTSTAGLSQFGY